MLHDGSQQEWGTLDASALYEGNPESLGMFRIVRELAKDSAPATGLMDLLRRNGLIYPLRDSGSITAISEIVAVYRDYRYQDEVANKGPTPDAIAARLRSVARLTDQLVKAVSDADWWSREQIEAAGIGWVELETLRLAKRRIDDAVLRAKRPRGGKRRDHALRDLASRLALMSRELTDGRNDDWRSFVHVTLTEFKVGHPDPKRHAAAFDALVHDEVHELLAAPHQPPLREPTVRPPRRGQLPPKPPVGPRTGIGTLADDLMRIPARRPRKGA